MSKKKEIRIGTPFFPRFSNSPRTRLRRVWKATGNQICCSCWVERTMGQSRPDVKTNDLAPRNELSLRSTSFMKFRGPQALKDKLPNATCRASMSTPLHPYAPFKNSTPHFHIPSISLTFVMRPDTKMEGAFFTSDAYGTAI